MIRRLRGIGVLAVLATTMLPVAYAEPTTHNYGPADLDLHRADGSEPSPVIVYVHGGPAAQLRKAVDDKPGFFNNAGFAFVALDHRRRPAASIDGQVDDIEQAVAWLRNNANAHGLDADRVILMGYSSGAHLATLAALTRNELNLNGIISIDTSHYDIRSAHDFASPQVKRIIEIAYPNKASWEDLSPASHVGSAQGLPFYLVSSNAEGFAASAATFKETLDDAHPVGLLYVPGLRHYEISRDIGSGTTQQLDDGILNFVRSVTR